MADHGMPHTPRVIVLDLDGTAVRYEPRLEIDPLLVRCLRAIRTEHSVAWVMNSDRLIEDMLALAAALPREDRPDALMSCQHLIYWAGPNGDFLPHCSWNRGQAAKRDAVWAQIRPHFHRWQQAIEEQFTVYECYVTERVFAFRVRPEEIPALRRWMDDRLTPWPVARVSGNHEWLFVIHRDFSKARVVREYARCRRVALDRVLAIGDGYNDLPMLTGRLTPMVGCPANACDEVVAAVRAAGGLVADERDAAGAVAVIRRYFAANPERSAARPAAVSVAVSDAGGTPHVQQ